MNSSPKANHIQAVLAERAKDLVRFLNSMVRSSADAEDLFQAGAVRAMEKAADLKDSAKAYPWLLGLYRNLALDFLRSGQRKTKTFSDLTPEAFENLADTAQDEAEARVCGCGKKLLKQIPEQYARILEKVEVEGAAVADAARELKTSPNNASVRLHRARHSLKKAVQEHCEVETFEECLDCQCGEDESD